jgi:hypothetical protein
MEKGDNWFKTMDIHLFLIGIYYLPGLWQGEVSLSCKIQIFNLFLWEKSALKTW